MYCVADRFDFWAAKTWCSPPTPSADALLRSLLDGAGLEYHSPRSKTGKWYEVRVPPNCVKTALAVHEAYCAVMGDGYGLTPDDVSRARELITLEDKRNDPNRTP